jgi:hypothetical protein
MEAVMQARLMRFVPTLLLAALFAAPAPAAAAKTYRAEQFTVRVDVQPGGAIHVTETIRFAFGSDSFTYVYREVPRRRTDGVTYVGASMDGVPMDRGSAPGQFEIKNRDNGRRRVVFHFAPITSSTHTFTLTYVAQGVVRQEADADVLAWQVLPTDHDYPIDRATADIRYPAAASVLGFSAIEPDARAELGDGASLRASRAGLGRDDEWPITVRFAPRTLVAVPPLWQQRQLLTRENIPLFLGLGGLILLTGVGGFLLFRLNTRPELSDDPQARTPAPPDHLPVALAGAVSSQWFGVSWPHALGALLDLARRGVVRVEPNRDPGLFKSKPFLIRRTGVKAALASHEQVLLDLLFTSKAGPRETLSFADVGRVVGSSRRWKRFTKAATADLRAAGLLDAERERLRGRVTILGLGLVIAGIAGLAICVPFLGRVGDALLILPVSLLAVGITGLGAGATFNVLSAEGQRRAIAARSYERYLADLSKHPSPSGAAGAIFEHALPYAAAFGVAVTWAKHLEKQGVTNGPPWLGALAQDQARSSSHMAATIAMLSAGSSAGAQAGGHAAGGAGAAGGGASGAG